MSTLADFSATSIEGRDVDLSSYQGEVALVVNTASKCGFTPQYKGLQELQDRYAGKGFTVLGFPCDQFAHQEPGDDADIATFCEKNLRSIRCTPNSPCRAAAQRSSTSA